jgi:hypothetical protein
MATIGNSFLNIIDHYSRTDNAGNVAMVIEALHQLNPLMQDAYVVEANQGQSHLSTIRTGLGDVAWGKLYQGIIQSKGTTQQVKDTTGFVERLSTIDTRYLKLVKDPAGERMLEANAALEAIAQDVQANFFYADTTTTPERFKGVASRYASIANGGAAAAQIVDGGGTGSANTSIWFLGWGAPATGLIFPQGTQAGIIREDKGEQRTTDDLGRPYFVKEEYFAQHIGVKVGDWRYNARICNIDVAAVLAGTRSVFPLLRQAYYKLQERRNTRIENGGMVSGVKPVIYMNRDMMQALDAESTGSGAADNKIRLTPDEVAGKEIPTYRGIPIRETDALINAEARVL